METPDAAEIQQTPTEAHAKQSRTIRAQGAFLAAFAKMGMVTRAAEAAGIDRWTHYEWLKVDPDYKREFERACTIVTDAWEDEAIRRAFHGVEKPVTVAGARELVKEYSDRLAEFILTHRKPEVYGKQRIEHTGPGGKPLLDLAEVDEFIRRHTERQS